LARGYFNKPDLTAEKFIPHPFTDEPGSRVYKTGDQARYLPNGNIQFLGRVDHQVKIRGFRIEPGEIEAALGEHPSVRETVVVAREDATAEHQPVDNPKSVIENRKSGKRLVAYIVCNDNRTVQIDELRTSLKSKLPDYMVPSVFVFLDGLPLDPNGKVNRRSLPAPDQARPDLKEPLVPPRTPAEKLIAEIWAEVLALKKIGIHDNFFDLGGHSLLGAQVISRVRDAFQVELPLRSLFESPTVAGLAVQVTQKKGLPKNTASVLAELESLSNDEAQLLLIQERSNSR
jgi:acyl carrier protein